jgi:hypothetical protein
MLQKYSFVSGYFTTKDIFLGLQSMFFIEAPWIGSMSYSTIQVAKFNRCANLGSLSVSQFFLQAISDK